MFGRKVKDVIALPIDTSTNRDRTKELDAFRTQKKISENEAVSKYGTKYYEFNNFITSETRKAYFGHEDIPEDVKEETKASKAQFVIAPITRHRYEDASIEEVPKDLEPEVENITVDDPLDVDPIVEETIEVATIDLEPEESTDDSQVTMESSFFSQTQTQTEPVKTAEKEVSEAKSTPKSSPKPKQSYLYHDVSLFEKSDNDLTEKPEWLMTQVDQLNTTLLDFNIEGQVIDSKKGPTVTRHEIALEPGVNVKKILNIQDNITMSLAATAVRIEAPIPGKPFVGVEVPNVEKDMVRFGNIVDDPQFLDSDKPLQVALGMDIDGSHVYANIESMPHGLIAGATNSGKSVCVNTIFSKFTT